MAVHARLSASAAERWLNCPGSQNAIEALPPSERNTTSYAAAEGTFAHNIAASCLQHGTMPVVGGVGVVEGHHIPCDGEMVASIREYIDVVRADRKDGDQCWVEIDVTEPLKKLHPDLGGTADHIRWRPSTGELVVTDFKYGAGVMVSPDDNKQLKTYALGAMLWLNKGAKKVTVRIVQPRIDHPDGPVRSFTFDGMALIEFAGQLVEGARAANKKDAPLTPGPWCRKTFCPAAATCPALEKQAHAMLSRDDFSAANPYDPIQLAKGLNMIAGLKAKIAAMESFAYAEASRGVKIPGWKLVEKRAVRKWANPERDRVVDELAQRTGRNVNDFLHEPEVLSPAQVEALIGKSAKARAALEGLVVSVSSGTTLVPDSDKRQEAKRLDDKDFASGAQVKQLSDTAASDGAAAAKKTIDFKLF